MSSYNNQNNTLTKFGSNIRVLNTPMEQYVTEGELVERLATKQDILQYDVLPTASAENLGKIVQYVGTTNADFVNSSFYKCVAKGTNPESYEWKSTLVTREEFENATPNIAHTEAFKVAENIEGVKVENAYQTLDNLTQATGYIKVGTGAIINDATSGMSRNVVIPVTEGEEYLITSSYAFRIAIYAFYDSNGNVISTYPTIPDQPRWGGTVKVIIPNGVSILKACTFNYSTRPLIIKKRIAEGNLLIDNPNILYKKKWCVCGDSFSAGSFLGYVDPDGKQGKESPIAWDVIKAKWKTYSWWIGTRNNMDILDLSKSGTDFTNIAGAVEPFSNENSPNNYTQIASDCDYITLAFGLNETTLTDEQIGTKTDNDNTTLWGAYNVVLESILTANPSVKIGIIISDSWMPQNYHDELIEIAKYWGIPYLDLKNGVQVPMGIRGRYEECSPTAIALRESVFMDSEASKHPTPKAHEYRSTFIENFLRGL